MIVRSSRFVAAICAASMLAATPAVAAARAAPAYSPWASLSAFASQSSSQALCGSAAAAAAASAAQGTPGCVLPAVDAPPPVPVSETAPLGTPAAAVAGGGIGLLPLLLGLAALGGIAALLLANGDGDDEVAISPA